MNYQQMIVRAKELMQEINDNGGTPYFSDTFRYDRGIGWEVKVDYAHEISWHNFSYRSHETGLVEYRNLRQVVDCLLNERNGSPQ